MVIDAQTHRFIMDVIWIIERKRFENNQKGKKFRILPKGTAWVEEWSKGHALVERVRYVPAMLGIGGT